MRSPLGYLRHKVRTKDGWFIQNFALPNEGSRPPQRRGYVKIFDPEGNYVDSALNPTNARKRIACYLRDGYPLFEKELA